MKPTWPIKPLRDVCQIRPPKSDARARVDSSDLVSFLPMEDLGVENKFLTPKQEKLFSDVAGSYTYFADGDVLLAKITPCFENGKLGIAQGLTNGIGFGSSEYIVFRPSAAVDKEWLYYFLSRESFRREGAKRMSGAVGHKRVSMDFIETHLIPLPPLPEQKRIVAILDEAFEGIDRAIANTKKNLANAREVFETSLRSVFDRGGAAWENLTLQDLLERGWIESHLDGNHGSDYPRKEEFISEGVPYVSANCIVDDHVEMARAKYLAPNRAALLRKGIARDRDVLFAHNATVGPVAILHTEHEKVILGTSLTYYRCNEKFILPEYLSQFMRSSVFKVQYLQIMRQSTRNQIPITKQREFYHVIPPMVEQKILVDQLGSIFEDGRRLESIYQRKLDALSDLRQAILQKAFAGELTARSVENLHEAAQ